MYANRTEIFGSIMSSITGKEMTIKMRKKERGRGESFERIDRENWIYKELAMRNTLFARAERKRRGIRETKDDGGRTSDRLGANNCTPLAISCITR